MFLSHGVERGNSMLKAKCLATEFEFEGGGKTVKKAGNSGESSVDVLKVLEV